MSENTQKKARSIEMVTGSLWKNIILFSIPLMCSQLLEVLFNLSDVAVVGRFCRLQGTWCRGIYHFARHIVCRISDWYGEVESMSVLPTHLVPESTKIPWKQSTQHFFCV